MEVCKGEVLILEGVFLENLDVFRKDGTELLRDYAPNPVVVNIPNPPPVIAVTVLGQLNILKPLVQIVGVDHRQLLLDSHVTRILDGRYLNRHVAHNRVPALKRLEPKRVAVIDPISSLAREPKRNLLPARARRIPAPDQVLIDVSLEEDAPSRGERAPRPSRDGHVPPLPPGVVVEAARSSREANRPSRGCRGVPPRNAHRPPRRAPRRASERRAARYYAAPPRREGDAPSDPRPVDVVPVPRSDAHRPANEAASSVGGEGPAVGQPPGSLRGAVPNNKGDRP